MRALLIVFAFLSLQINEVNADMLFQPESSLPEPGLPLAVDINKSFQKTIRVKVFPHDLKNDWVHGRADNSQEVELQGESFEINGVSARSAKIVIQGSRLKVSLDSSPARMMTSIDVYSDGPIKVVRKKNLEKSHSYLGSLEIFPENSKIVVVNHVDIETYLKGVVPKESVSSWPIEALKAQAVAARTYAYYHLLTSSRKNYDVDDTARFQVYAGHSARTENTDEAVRQTDGQVLTHKSKVIVAFFHAYSGGRTDSALNIFGNPADYCLGAEEIFSREELHRELKPSSRWIVEWTTDWMGKSTLMSKLKASSHSRSTFRNLSSSRSFNIIEAELNEGFDSVKTLEFRQSGQIASLNFINIRKVLGWSNFPAYHFRLLEDGDQVAFKGHGWGHHVGLSQWGAFIMAKNYGKTYDEILLHYYSNVELSYL